jgi:hypothetical protein
VLAGLCPAPEGDSRAVVLRRGRLRAVRGDHPTARILLRPAPKPRSSSATARFRRRGRAGPRGGRVRLGLERTRPRC